MRREKLVGWLNLPRTVMPKRENKLLNFSMNKVGCKISCLFMNFLNGFEDERSAFQDNENSMEP